MTSNAAIRRALALILALMIALCAAPVLAEDPEEPAESAQPTATAGSTYDAEHPEKLLDADLEGQSCVLINRATGQVLYEKDANAKRYPASTTKIMTLLLAVEYGHFDEVVEIPQEAQKIPSDSSQTPVLPGERMTFEQLLYGMMLPSGNDSSNAVAVIVAGSLDAFVEKMNTRAKELGCTGTNFVNAHGYHDDNHYTTAADLAKIAAEGMKNEMYRTIVSTLYYTLPATKFRANGLEIENHNKMLFGSSPFYYPQIQGIKTGFHSLAGQCFVAAAAQDGINLVSVTLKTSNDGRWIDTKRMMEYGFAQYQKYTFEALFSEHPLDVEVQNAAPDDPQGGKLALALAPGGSLNGYSMTIRSEDGADKLNQIITNSELTYTHMLQAPIQKGDEIATLTAKYADGTALTATLLAARDVAVAPAPTPTEVPPEVRAQQIREAETNVNLIRVLVIVVGVLLIATAVFLVVLKVRKDRERERRRQAALKRKKAAQRRRREMGQ